MKKIVIIFFTIATVFCSCTTSYELVSTERSSHTIANRDTLKLYFWGLAQSTLDSECNINKEQPCSCDNGAISKVKIITTFKQKLIAFITLGIHSRRYIEHYCCKVESDLEDIE